MANEGMRNTVYVRWNLVNLNSFMISWLHPVPETESNHIRRELCPAIRAECSIPCPCCSGSQSCERKVVMTGLWCCFQKPPLGGILCLVIHHSRVCKCEPLIHSTHSSASCPLDVFFYFISPTQMLWRPLDRRWGSEWTSGWLTFGRRTLQAVLERCPWPRSARLPASCWRCLKWAYQFQIMAWHMSWISLREGIPVQGGQSLHFVLTSNWELRFSIRRLYCDGTFVLLSIKGLNKPDVSPCYSSTRSPCFYVQVARACMGSR